MDTERPPWARVRRAAHIAAWLLLGTVVLGAIAGSDDLVTNLRHPTQACQEAAPEIPVLEATKAQTAWPPPMVRCEYKYVYPSDDTAVVRGTAVTTKNLVVVALTDLVTIIILAMLIVPSLRLCRRLPRAVVNGWRDSLDNFRTQPRPPTVNSDV